MTRLFKYSFASLLIFFMSISISFSKTENKLPDTNESAKELPVKMVPGFYSGAESYFSPDGKKLIFNAKVNKDDKEFHVYTVNIDGTDKRLINDKGEDACSYFFPDGKRLVFTSTRDNLNLPPGDYSKPEDYPTGAELYMCGIDGSNRKRLTFNKYYDAEVSVSPDGNWILFGRQINGQMDLWRMRPDGSGEIQVTHSPDLQEGGAFYLPDSKHIIFRAWKIEDQTKRGKPMTIYTIDDNGKDLKPLTTDSSTNWSPHPAPDGKHFVFVKVLMPHNFEVFLMNMETGKQTRVTYNKAFDAFPSFSPDGKTISFSSTRDAEKDVRGMSIYLMDISSLLSK